jgi:hypothetical protein
MWELKRAPVRMPQKHAGLQSRTNLPTTYLDTKHQPLPPFTSTRIGLSVRGACLQA